VISIDRNQEKNKSLTIWRMKRIIIEYGSNLLLALSLNEEKIKTKNYMLTQIRLKGRR